MVPVMDAKLSATDVHGKGGDAFLAFSSVQLVEMFKKGGKDRTAAGLEIGRRKVNRIIEKQGK